MTKLAHCLRACVLAIAGVAAAYGGEPRVSLELATAPGFPISGSQKWIKTLDGLGFASVRIRTGRGGDQPSTRELGEADSRSYRVVGILTSKNKLLLPGGSFSQYDRGGIKTWLAKLKSGGKKSLTESTVAFGLTEEQLVRLYGQLGQRISFATAGRQGSKIVKVLVRQIPLTVSIEPASRAKLAHDFVLHDELQGTTLGVGLAAALRPLGLAFMPVRKGNAVSLAVVDAATRKKTWPVGWPAQRPPRTLTPQLFKFLNVEIEDIPLTDAIAAVQGRLDMNVLWDHAKIKQRGIEPEKVKVSLPAGRTYYRKILNRLLAQAKLKGEVRTDESEQPFLWITTIRP